MTIWYHFAFRAVDESFFRSAAEYLREPSFFISWLIFWRVGSVCSKKFFTVRFSLCESHPIRGILLMLAIALFRFSLSATKNICNGFLIQSKSIFNKLCMSRRHIFPHHQEEKCQQHSLFRVTRKDGKIVCWGANVCPTMENKTGLTW